MSKKQTGSEDANVKAPEPNEVVVDEGNNVSEPTNSATEEGAVSENQKAEPEKLSDEDVLKKLQPITEEKPKESRKLKTIKRSVQSYNKSLDEDGAIIGDTLLQEYEKNPKGLNSFAESIGVEPEALMEIIEEEAGYQEDGLVSEVNSLKEEIHEIKSEKQANEYKQVITDLVSTSGITLNDFYTNYGEDFNLFLIAYKQQGKSDTEAAKLAYEKVSPNIVTPGQELASTIKKMPLGSNVVPTVDPVMVSREAYRKMPQEAKVAYLGSFRNKDGTPKFA